MCIDVFDIGDILVGPSAFCAVVGKLKPPIELGVKFTVFEIGYNLFNEYTIFNLNGRRLP
jgi:hypothetical protein